MILIEHSFGNIILMTIHVSSLTGGDIEDSEIVMLYDDMGSVPGCVFALGFYRETLIANESMIKKYFNPGCALSIYKPELENKILKFLNENYGEVALHN